MGNSIGSLSHSAARRRLLAAAAAGAATVLAGCDAPGDNARRFNATDITGVQWGRGFDLTDHTGHRRTLVDFKGKVVLLFFGYTNCPGPCPTALAEMAQVVKQVGAGIFIFDKQGRARLFVRASGRSVDAMIHDVKRLLKQ